MCSQKMLSCEDLPFFCHEYTHRNASSPDEGEEFLSSFWILSENSQHSTCNCFAVNLLNTSHNHAHVPGMYKILVVRYSEGLHFILIAVKDFKSHIKGFDFVFNTEYATAEELTSLT